MEVMVRKDEYTYHACLLLREKYALIHLESD